MKLCVNKLKPEQGTTISWVTEKRFDETTQLSKLEIKAFVLNKILFDLNWKSLDTAL